MLLLINKKITAMKWQRYDQRENCLIFLSCLYLPYGSYLFVNFVLFVLAIKNAEAFLPQHFFIKIKYSNIPKGKVMCKLHIHHQQPKGFCIHLEWIEAYKHLHLLSVRFVQKNISIYK